LSRTMMARFRIFQQIRIWVYQIIFAVGGIIIWYVDGGGGAAFVLVLAALLLLHLEICPWCQRLVWREGLRTPFTFWILFPTRSFWISLECREIHSSPNCAPVGEIQVDAETGS
jgi:hypothetical protein